MTIKPLLDMWGAVREVGLRQFGRIGPPPRSRMPVETVPSYHAVSILPGAICCSAVAEMSQHRYLSRHARLLPLTSCTLADQCRCTFRKHADRRVGYDRRSVFANGDGVERRRSRGRRATDF